MADDHTMPDQTLDPALDSAPEPTPGEPAGTASTPAKNSPRKAAKATKAAKAGASKAAKATKSQKAVNGSAKTTNNASGDEPPAKSRPAPRKSAGATRKHAGATQKSTGATQKPRPTPRKTETSVSGSPGEPPRGQDNPEQAGPPPEVPPTPIAEAAAVPAAAASESAPAVSAAAPAAPAATGGWAEAAWEALRQPGQPPHRLAQLAVAELGPRAAAWAEWLRRTYPGAPALGIARLAAQQARRQHWALLATEAAGPLAPAVHLPGITVVQALLVLRVAAAYGHDPADQARATELLDLLGLGEDASWFDRLSTVGTAFGRVRLGRRLAGAVRLVLTFGEEHDQLERLAHRAALRYRAAGRPT